ncbi:MAG: glutathione S-transferase family protein [Rhodobacteraceae bacterium]|nr:MAG: glutathione S-transferase family protein [Paracoccaceae bacterium]
MRRLYHMPLSAQSRKIRLVLGEKKLEAELIEERVWERRLDFLRLNPAGEVPVLIDRDGRALADSAAIFEYLEETGPEPRLLPSDPIDRAEARRLVGWFDGKFNAEVTESLVAERAVKRLARTGHPDSARIKAGARAIKTHLEYVGWLVERRHWLAGETLTIADFAAAAHLSCLDYIGDVPWEVSDPAKEWYARVKSRPCFRPLLSDHLPGFSPPAHYADPDF